MGVGMWATYRWHNRKHLSDGRKLLRPLLEAHFRPVSPDLTILERWSGWKQARPRTWSGPWRRCCSAAVR